MPSEEALNALLPRHGDSLIQAKPAILALAYDTGSDALFAASRNGDLQMWHVTKCLEQLECEQGQPVRTLSSVVPHCSRLVVFQSRLFAFCSRAIISFDLGLSAQASSQALPGLCHLSAQCGHLCFLACGADVLRFDLTSGQLVPLQLQRTSSGAITSMCVYSSGDVIALGLASGDVELFGLAASKSVAMVTQPFRRLKGHAITALAVDVDNRWLAIGTLHGTCVVSLKSPSRAILDFACSSMGLNWASDKLISFGNERHVSFLEWSGHARRLATPMSAVYAVKLCHGAECDVLVLGGEGPLLSLTMGPTHMYVIGVSLTVSN